MTKFERFLISKKIDLSYKIDTLTLLLEKYNLPGTIVKKTINKKIYHYLQFRDERKQLVSIYLNNEILDIFEEALRSKEKLAKELQTYMHDISLLSKVKVSDSSQKEKDSFSVKIPQLMKGSVGISRLCHVPFYLTPTENDRNYQINYIYKRKYYQLHHVCFEASYKDIPVNIASAGTGVDYAICSSFKNCINQDRLISCLSGETRQHNTYSCKLSNNKLIVTCNNEIQFEYIPQYPLTSENYFLLDMDIAGETDKFVNKYYFDKALEEYSEKHIYS